MDNRAAVSAPQIDGVVFDCDGVLVDSESLSTQVTQKIVADLGWHVELDVLGDLLTGCSHEFYVEQVEKNIGRTLEPGWDDPYRGRLDAVRRDRVGVEGCRAHALSGQVQLMMRPPRVVALDALEEGGVRRVLVEIDARRCLVHDSVGGHSLIEPAASRPRNGAAALRRRRAAGAA